MESVFNPTKQYIDALRGGGGIFGFKAYTPDGRPQPLWDENWLGRKIRMFLDRFVFPMDGFTWDEIEAGLHTRHHHWLRFFGLGKWTTDVLWGTNLLTNIGLAFVASRINGAGAEAVINGLAVGTSVTAESATHTNLQAEILTATDSTFDREVATTITRTTTTQINDTSRLDTTFGAATAAHAVTEAGAFIGAVSNEDNKMLARKQFSVINISIGGSLQVIYDFPITQG
jgi:hypothetical protein